MLVAVAARKVIILFAVISVEISGHPWTDKDRSKPPTTKTPFNASNIPDIVEDFKPKENPVAMMMSNPSSVGEDAPPAFASKPTDAEKKSSAVADLEKRLAMLGGPTNAEAAPPPFSAVVASAPPPAVAPPPAAPTQAPAPSKSGKNALLVGFAVLFRFSGFLLVASRILC